jgi:zinc transporter
MKLSSRHAQLPGDRFAPLVIPGLVCAYRFGGEGSAEPLEHRLIPTAMAEGQGWVWLHVALTDTLARSFIETLRQLPEPARALLVGPDERLGLEAAGGAIFGILADFERDLDGTSWEVGRLRFAATSSLVITGRRHPLRSIDEIRQDLHAGLKLADAGSLVEAIVDRFCEASARLSVSMADQLDQIEDSIVSGRVEQERTKLVPLRRTAVRLHRNLSSLTAVFRDWSAREEEEESLTLDVAADRLARRTASLDQDVLGIQDRARLFQDEVSARLAEETNRSLRALSVMTALLLPGSLVAGLFGMNVHDLPLSQTEGGFFIAVLIGAAATAAFYLVLRRIGAGLRL